MKAARTYLVDNEEQAANIRAGIRAGSTSFADLAYKIDCNQARDTRSAVAAELLTHRQPGTGADEDGTRVTGLSRQVL